MSKWKVDGFLIKEVDDTFTAMLFRQKENKTKFIDKGNFATKKQGKKFIKLAKKNKNLKKAFKKKPQPVLATPIAEKANSDIINAN